MAEDQKPVVLRVPLKFASIEDRDEFLAAWRPLAAYVRANEAGALAYEALISDSNPLQVELFERYTSRQYASEVHMTSKPFQEFFGAYLAEDAEWRKQHPLEFSLEYYSESGIGHLQR